MAVRPIDANTLIDKWRQVQRNFKRGGENHWAELADMVIDDVSRAPTLLLVDINTVPTLTQPNEPLTLEELWEMDGQPVWVEDVKHWALIDIGKGGQWDGVPFAIWAENGVRFCYNVIDRNLICYRRPPEGEEEA